MKVHNLIIKYVNIDENDKILDIGTGSGALLINLAKKYSKSSFTGIDYWGEDWEYSQAQCESNAKLERVDGYVKFKKASASALPFKDSEFNSVVSCLTFHEVKDEGDKTKVIKEALRVLKLNGIFVFIDLFKDEKFFGNISTLVEEIKNFGVKEVNVKDIREELDVSRLLLVKKILGNAMILYGQK